MAQKLKPAAAIGKAGSGRGTRLRSIPLGGKSSRRYVGSVAERAGELGSSIPLGSEAAPAEAGEPPVLFVSYRSPDALPRPRHEYGNVLICVPGPSNNRGFGVLARQVGQSLDLPFPQVRCFPFYTYNDDGSIRRENITDWAWNRFREHYKDPVLSKWSIFDYIYGVLHHPEYPALFAEDLKRGSPGVPFAPSFRAFQRAGQKLIELHLHADKLEPWELQVDQNGAASVGAETKKLALSHSMTLSGIPTEALDYRLGSRPAIEWLLDRRRQDTADRSEDPQQLARLAGQWVRMSLETVNLIKTLPALVPEDRRP